MLTTFNDDLTFAPIFLNFMALLYINNFCVGLGLVSLGVPNLPLVIEP
ncbi:hypothetical protein A608_0913 [Helicobacter pylori CCHI 33]|nr:hypothetical protein A608_0913 [Helicobacter pylori CCHI 33]